MNKAADVSQLIKDFEREIARRDNTDLNTYLLTNKPDKLRRTLNCRAVGVKRHYRAQTLSDEQIDQHNWYMISVPPQKEFAAWLILNQRGFTVYLPTERKYRRANRYKKSKELTQYPLMSRYMFVGFDGFEDWYSLFRFHLVQNVLGVNGEPKQIDRNWIKQSYRAYHDYKPPHELKYMRSGHEFKEGDMVEVIDGPFDGHKIKVEEIVGKKAISTVKFLNIDTKVSIPLDNLINAA
jgi:transcription antitermination factor NusG